MRKNKILEHVCKILGNAPIMSDDEYHQLPSFYLLCGIIDVAVVIEKYSLHTMVNTTEYPNYFQ